MGSFDLGPEALTDHINSHTFHLGPEVRIPEDIDLSFDLL